MKAKNSDQIDVDCYCEILCNLSDDGSSTGSSCNCDDCVQAMAEAYNEFLKDSQKDKRTRTLQNTANRDQQNSPSQSKHHRNQSTKHGTSHAGYDRCNRCTRWEKCTHNSGDTHSQSLSKSESQSNIKSMVERVNQRMQENLKKHRELKAEQIKQKEEYMRKVKEDLEKLKYRARIEVEKAENKNPMKEAKVWNYQPCADLVVKPTKCFEGRHREKMKEPTMTGQVDYDKLGQHQFLKDLKRRVKMEYRKAKMKHTVPKKAQCQYDNCDKHHMRTPPQNIQEALEKIKQRAKKYAKQMEKQKQMKEDKAKIVQAKLKGLAIEAKRKLDMSKKQTADSQKSSFKLDLDHFSTFSEMRERQQLIQQEKKREKQMQQRIAKTQQNKAVSPQMKQTKVHYDRQNERPQANSKRSQSPGGVHKKSSRSIQQPQIRQQQVDRVRQQLQQQPLLRKPYPGRPPPQQENKFYEWDLPIDEERMKGIFQQAKITMPPGSKKKKGKNTKEAEKKEGKEEQREDEEEVKVQNVTKTKIKEKLEDRLLREKKQQLEKKLKKNKQQQLKLYQQKKQKVYSKYTPKPKTKPKPPAQPNYPAQPMPSFQPPQYDRSDPYSHTYGIYNRVQDPDSLAEGKIHVQDPILDKMEFDHKKKKINQLEHVLLDNDFLSEEDKKVFILNYKALVKEKGLKV